MATDTIYLTGVDSDGNRTLIPVDVTDGSINVSAQNTTQSGTTAQRDAYFAANNSDGIPHHNDTWANTTLGYTQIYDASIASSSGAADGWVEYPKFNDEIQSTAGGQSETVSISGTSAQSSAIGAGSCTIYSTVDCYYREGSNPTALADGTDDFIPGGNKIRITGILSTNKLAFITGGASGTVYITPGG